MLVNAERPLIKIITDIFNYVLHSRSNFTKMKNKLLLISASVLLFGQAFSQNPLNITTSTTPATNCTAPCNGTATATPTNGTPPYTYLWNVNPPQQTQTATGLCPGQWQVGVWDASTPFPNQGTVLVTIICSVTGVNTFSPDESISIFPNPAGSELNLNLESLLQGKSEVIIRNIFGQSVYKEIISVNGSLVKRIDISSFAAGVYTVEIVNGSETIRTKFIKQ